MCEEQAKACFSMKNDSTYKIVLVSIFNDEAIGLRQLYAISRNRGYEIALMFFKLDSLKKYEKRRQDTFTNKINEVSDKELDLFCRFITETKPDLIGFSLVSSHFYLYKRLFARLRPLGDFKIILGGWQPSLNPEECLPYCDILCIGEGDEAFAELTDRLSMGKSADNIKNIWFKKGAEWVKNEPRPLNRNADLLPNIVFEDGAIFYIENDGLIEQDPQFENERYGVIAGRGCPYRCTYCSNSYMATTVYPNEWSKIRRRSVGHVMEELVAAKRKFSNIKRINFYDEVFMPDMVWAREFADRYKKEIGLPFYCMFYPGTCKEGALQILKESMLAGDWMGIQSGSARVRREIFKRNYSEQLILEQAELFRKYGVSARYDFIFDNPFETFEESLESIDLMLKLPEPYSLNIFSLKYFPKTDITKMALSEGLISSENMDDHLFRDNHNIFVSQKGDATDSNFVDHLAMYISFLASDSQVQRNKRSIEGIIRDYRATRDIEPIRSIVADCLCEEEASG